MPSAGRASQPALYLQMTEKLLGTMVKGKKVSERFVKEKTAVESY